MCVDVLCVCVCACVRRCVYTHVKVCVSVLEGEGMNVHDTPQAEFPKLRLGLVPKLALQQKSTLKSTHTHTHLLLGVFILAKTESLRRAVLH